MWVRGVPSCHYLPAVLFWEEQPFPVMAARFLYPTLVCVPETFWIILSVLYRHTALLFLLLSRFSVIIGKQLY